MFRSIARATLGTALVAAGSFGAVSAAHAAPAAPDCTTEGTAVTAEYNDSGMNKTYYRLKITNTGGGTCSMTGFPGVDHRGPHSPSFGSPAWRTDAAKQQVVLQPGQSAYASLAISGVDVYPAEKCEPLESPGLSVTLPDAAVPHAVDLPHLGCSSTTTSNMSIGPVRPA